MNKLFSTSLFFITFILLVACSNEKIERIEKIDFYKTESFSETEKSPLIEITDTQIINNLRKAFNSAKKQPGIVDMISPEYKVNIGGKSYFLWISEKSGTIMNVEDTHTIYSLSNESIKSINELMTSKFDK
ncbi:hypothetical protein [Metabacillus fastidiosus]|uniref:YhfM-like domain-containing protein n=1 Tax=Metabacillus fastidiosus TaxID=1458 RepID=A0ABU6NTB7_9BACI|nr:hypothetical protein [Metabacillus fastidiosus]